MVSSVQGGTIGLYDTVEGEFYTNAGTGEFQNGENVDRIRGNNITANEKNYTIEKTNKKGLPMEFQEVEYIKSTGVGFIQTDLYIGNAKTIRIENEFMIEEEASGNNTILGAGFSTDSYEEFKFPNWCDGNIEIRGYGIDNNNAATLAKNQRAYMIFYYRDGSQTVTLNNNLIINTNNQFKKFADIPQLNIFSNHGIGTVGRFAKARLYKLSVELDEKMVRNFIPCYCTTAVTNKSGYRCEKGTIGLYDVVEGNFYSYSVNNALEKGPDVNY